jgi:hypothetical protein
VHLGNIPVEEAISLETLRRGLRADTLRDLVVPADALGEALAAGEPA